jgi:hypothetical protein
MRVTVQFINPHGKFALIAKLLQIVKGITHLRQHILAHGIVLERLSAGEVATLQQMLAQEDRFTYLTSDSTIRVRVTDGDLRALLGLGLVIPIPRRRNYFADIFWERGFTIEKLEPGQANDLRKQIEAIATVTVAPDIAQTCFCTVSGQVYQTNGVPLDTRGFTVRAFDSLPGARLVSCGTTAALQANGTYRIDYAWHTDGRKGPDLIIRVFDPQGHVVAEAGKGPAAVQEYIDITATGVGIIRGTIHTPDGSPVADVIVRAFDRNLREEITYSGNAPSPGSRKTRADLIIRAFAIASSDGSAVEIGDEIGASPIVFNAPQLQIIDLEISSVNDPSEYERHIAELQPLIEGESVKSLSDEDLRFLSGKTGIPFDQLNYLRLDAQWTGQYALDPAVAYGLFRQELPANLRGLLAEKPSRLREALKASLARNIIPGSISDQTDQVIQQLLSLADSPALTQYARAG